MSSAARRTMADQTQPTSGHGEMCHYAISILLNSDQLRKSLLVMTSAFKHATSTDVQNGLDA